MVLNAEMGAVIGKVFMIYAAFWVLVLIVLFLGVGALLKKRQRILDRQHHGSSHH